MLNKNNEFKDELEKQYTILIKAERKSQHIRNIAILSLLVITLITTLVCLIISSKTLINTQNKIEENTKTATYYQTLSVSYNNGRTLDLSGIGNGYVLSNPKTITLVNDGDAEIVFSIKLTSINSSLSSTRNLVYTITKNSETSIEKELFLSENDIISNVTIAPQETITYIINARFTGQLEENNYENYYKANIEVISSNNQTSLLE